MSTVIEQSSTDLVEQAVEQLRAAGKRMTTSRRLLLRCLFDGDSHRTAEELTAEMQSVIPDISLSTVYRNLDELEHLGIVGQVALGHGPATYYLATERHGHVVCEICGTVFELPAKLFSDIAKYPRNCHNVILAPHHYAVLGTCSRCVTESATI